MCLFHSLTSSWMTQILCSIYEMWFMCSVFPTKVMFVLINFVSLVMLLSLIINVSFLLVLNYFLTFILPNFDELPLSLNYLNLELCILIVHRLYPFLRLTSSDIVPTISRIELKSNQFRVWHTLWVWDSTICLSLTSSWSIRFSHTFLNATLSTTHIPICYYEAVKH